MLAAPDLAPLPVRHTRKGERTAERILDVAQDLFAERGFAGTTLRDVAARAGLRNPSLYNHFRSKESLYGAVLARDLGPVLEVLGRFVASESLESARLVEELMELLAQRPHVPRLIQHEMLSGGERLSPLLADWIGPALARGQQLVEADPAAARWRPEQVPLLVLAMYQIVVGYFTIAPLWKQLNGEDLLSKQALARQTQLVGDIVSALFAEDAEHGSASGR